jgi:drug/metabolite transporter (DMT)-like permease
VIYLGVIATGLCNYLQTIGQRSVSAEKASIIFSLDPVYSAVFARYFLDERLGTQGYVGAAVILIGVIISTLDGYKGDKSM